MNKGYCPWGSVQDVYVIADGIEFISTASHGGFRLSDERVAQLPSCMRENGSPYHDGGAKFWEEDCEAAFVVLAFPAFFESRQLENAKNTAIAMRNSCYDKIAKHFVGDK
jgi:hypothetical protein